MGKTKLKSSGVSENVQVTPTPVGDDVSAEDRVRAVIGSTIENDYEGWGASLFQKRMKLVSATASPAGRVIFEYTVTDADTNRLGNLHGGCTATLFDFATTTALAPIAKQGYWAFMGVSRTLNVTYLRPIPVGETILIDSEVVHAGKRLATIKGVMKRKSDGAVLAICEHGKASIDPEVSGRL